MKLERHQKVIVLLINMFAHCSSNVIISPAHSNKRKELISPAHSNNIPICNNSPINLRACNQVRTCQIKPCLEQKYLTCSRIKTNSNGILEPTRFEGDGYNELAFLSLSGCGILHLDQKVFYNLICLQHLNLSANVIESISSSTFRFLFRLTSLDLSANKITSFEDKNIFKNLENLLFLQLGENHISSLNVDLFTKTAKLTSLYLNSNHISVLPTGLFKGLTKLEILDLSNNKIRRLDEELLRPLKSLKDLFLHSNSFICNCELHTVLSSLKSSLNKRDITCLDSQSKEQQWLDVNFEDCSNISTESVPRPKKVNDSDNSSGDTSKDKDNPGYNLKIYHIVLYTVIGLVLFLVIIVISFGIKVWKNGKTQDDTEGLAIYHNYEYIDYNPRPVGMASTFSVSPVQTTVPSDRINGSMSNFHDGSGYLPPHAAETHANSKSQNSTSVVGETDEPSKGKHLKHEDSDSQPQVSESNINYVIQRLTKKRRDSDSEKLVINSVYEENI